MRVEFPMFNLTEHGSVYLSLQIPDEPHFYCELFTFFEGINYISSIKVPPPSNITYYRKPMSAW